MIASQAEQIQSVEPCGYLPHEMWNMKYVAYCNYVMLYSKIWFEDWFGDGGNVIQQNKSENFQHIWTHSKSNSLSKYRACDTCLDRKEGNLW